MASDLTAVGVSFAGIAVILLMTYVIVRIEMRGSHHARS